MTKENHYLTKKNFVYSVRPLTVRKQRVKKRVSARIGRSWLHGGDDDRPPRDYRRRRVHSGFVTHTHVRGVCSDSKCHN